MPRYIDFLNLIKNIQSLYFFLSWVLSMVVVERGEGWHFFLGIPMEKCQHPQGGTHDSFKLQISFEYCTYTLPEYHFPNTIPNIKIRYRGWMNFWLCVPDIFMNLEYTQASNTSSLKKKLKNFV